MSNTIDVARVQQYKSNLMIRYQQEGSKLRRAVRLDADWRGKNFFVDRLSATEVYEITTRHADTQLVDSQHTRRMGVAKPFGWADLVDPIDVNRILIDPAGAYVTNAVNAHGRNSDKTIITGFNDSALEGETGATSTPLPAAQKIAGGAAGLTKAKLVESSKILNLSNVPMEDRFIVVSPAGLEDLLLDNEITSADFNSVKLLMAGTISQFMGYEWIISTLLPLSGSDRQCFAWHKRSMLFALLEDVVVDVGPRRDKNNNVQVFVRMDMGAVRVEDEGVVEITIVE